MLLFVVVVTVSGDQAWKGTPALGKAVKPVGVLGKSKPGVKHWLARKVGPAQRPGRI